MMILRRCWRQRENQAAAPHPRHQDMSSNLDDSFSNKNANLLFGVGVKGDNVTGPRSGLGFSASGFCCSLSLSRSSAAVAALGFAEPRLSVPSPLPLFPFGAGFTANSCGPA